MKAFAAMPVWKEYYTRSPVSVFFVVCRTIGTAGDPCTLTRQLCYSSSERDRRVEIADNNTRDTFTRRLLQSAR